MATNDKKEVPCFALERCPFCDKLLKHEDPDDSRTGNHHWTCPICGMEFNYLQLKMVAEKMKDY